MRSSQWTEEVTLPRNSLLTLRRTVQFEMHKVMLKCTGKKANKTTNKIKLICFIFEMVILSWMMIMGKYYS